MAEPKSLPFSLEGVERKTSLEILPNGTIRMVYSDDLWAFADKIGGDMRATCRASNVEWEDIGGLKGWVVRAAHDPTLAIKDVGSSEPVFVCNRVPENKVAIFTSRELAIKYEIHFFHDLLPPVKPEET